MKLSKLTDYSVVLLARLGQKPNARDVVDARGFRLSSASQLAEDTGIPLPTTQKLLKLLAQADLVRSIRGARGGYMLSRSATCINVADVIAAVEGPIALTACVEEIEPCDVQNICALKGNWDNVNKAVLVALQKVTLVDMAPWFGPLPETRHP